MDYLSLLFSIIAGGFVTAICIRLLTPVALRIGLIDTPGGRKKHGQPVPLIGGIAIFMGFCFSLLSLNISLHNFRGLLAGSGILLLIGIMDDFHELTPRIRLIGQCMAAFFLMELGHLSVLHLGNLFFLGGVDLNWFAFPLTMILVLGFINAVNMIDGNDGLAGMIILGQAIFFILLSIQYHQVNNICLLILFCVTLCVFLRFNFPFLSQKRASIFLGDAGSTVMGFVIAWFSVQLSQVIALQTSSMPAYRPITVLWILAYPLFDLLAVIGHRLQAKKSPLSAGRDHLHHLLFDYGFSRVSITLLLFGLSMGLGAMGFLFAFLSITESWQFILFLGCFLTYFVVSRRLLGYCTRNQLLLNE